MSGTLRIPLTSSSRTWTSGRSPWSEGVASLGQIDHASETSPSMSPDQNCRPPGSNAHGTHPGAHSMLEELCNNIKNRSNCKHRLTLRANNFCKQTCFFQNAEPTYRDWTSAPSIAVSNKTTWERSSHGKMYYALCKLMTVSSTKLTCSTDCKSRFALRRQWNHFHRKEHDNVLDGLFPFRRQNHEHKN